MRFKNIKKELPKEWDEVLLFNKKWIDPDTNSKGVRIGFINEDGVFQSAEYSSYKDCYFNRTSEHDDKGFESNKAVDQVPTHWAVIEVEL